MDIEQIRSVLTSEIHSTPSDEADGNEIASVLIVIYGKNPFIIMTEKARNLKVHAGEIAFPGGKWCENDQDLLETAIRETKEELCLNVSKEHVIGQLDSVITLNSRYRIIPFIAILDAVPSLTANSEVESILHIPLAPFLNTMVQSIPDTSRLAMLGCLQDSTIMVKYAVESGNNTLLENSLYLLRNLLRSF